MGTPFTGADGSAPLRVALVPGADRNLVTGIASAWTSQLSRPPAKPRLAGAVSWRGWYLFPGEDGPDRGVGRGPAEVVGEDAAGVGHDPDVQHLRRVGVMPGRRVAGAPQLDAEAGDGRPAGPACHQVRVPAG